MKRFTTSLKLIVILGILGVLFAGLNAAALATKDGPQPGQLFSPAQDNSGPTGDQVILEVREPIIPAVFDGDLRDLPADKPDILNIKEAEAPPMPPPIDQGLDPVLQIPNAGGPDMPAATTFIGLDFSAWGAGWPPDTHGDVGADYYIQAVNTSIGIYNKSGTRLWAGTFDTFFDGTGTACDNSNMGDPIVIYDYIADRWLITDFAWSSSSGPFYECLAISQTSNPLSGGWWFYAYPVDNTSPYWMNDYPKFGLWPDAYYMSVNMFSYTSGTFRGPWAVAFDRADMLTGSPMDSVVVQLSTTYFSLLPSNVRGAMPPAGAPNYFFAVSWTANNIIQMWKFQVNWASPGSSTFTGPTNITVATFDSNFSAIPQQGTTQTLDTLARRPMTWAQYRNFGSYESVLLNHSVDVDTANDIAGIRWYEIRNPAGTPTVYQQASFGSTGAGAVERWMGSMAADRLNNMALGYSASNASMYPAIRYVGRLVTDPLNSLPQAEGTLYAGTGSQTTYNRWGDYSAMTVDSEDDCTFWYTTEYLATTGTNWQTRVGYFKYPTCNSVKYWVGGVSTAWSNANNWSPVGVPTRFDDVIIDTAHKTTYWPTLDANGEAHSVTIDTGAQLNASSAVTLKVYGDWTQNGTGFFNATNGTVQLLGTSPAAVTGTPSTTNHFYHLQIGDGTRTPAVTLGSNLRVDGNLTLYGRTSLAAGANTIYIGGNLNVQGTFSPGTSTVRFFGDLNNHTISAATSPLNFYNLVAEGTRTTVQAVNVAVANNLTVNSGAFYDLSTYSLSVDGAVTNNGALIQTRNTPSGSTTEFLHIRNAANTADKYFGVNITPSGNMGATTVRVYGNQPSCSSNPADPLIKRCFDIAPTTSQNATLRLYYTEAERNGQIANALKLWHFASGWSQVGNGYTYSESGSTCVSGTPAGSACWMQALNVSSFSPFGLGSGGTPTRVTVRSLAATSQAVSWLPAVALILLLGGGTLLWRHRKG